ncbi:MAG: hypothetical protein E7471_02950 [Ruminococcaceae bacterium]|nr:hypothetical protein [Oscillospiraceae bacterium]
MNKLFEALKTKKWLVGVFAAVLAVVVVFGALAIYTAAHTDIFPRVSIDGLSLGGMNRQEAISAMAVLDEEYGAAKFSVTAADVATSISGVDLGVQLDKEALADAALGYGHNGSFWNRMMSTAKTLLIGRELEPTVKLDQELLDVIISKIAEVNVEPQDASFSIEGDKMTLTPPVDGSHFDEAAFRARLKEKFEQKDHGDMVLAINVWEAKHLNLDEVYAEVHKVAKDAVIETVDGKKVLTPHVVGVDFDLEAAKKALDATPDQKIEIPLTLTKPKVTTEQLQSSNELFSHTLSKVTTRYSAHKTNRVSNVKLAAKLVNGTVLNPGEVFSYNKVVGPRTTARGFKAAGVFAGGEVVDGIGGGICQVSSTLYMASMYADLETVKRTNHAFYVDYAPKGEDATVVYGSIDFQFRNNTDAPIKIFATANNTSVTVTIKGTVAQQKTVKIQTTTHSTTPFTEKIVEDPSLKPGERVIKQAGQQGMHMTVYRLVYDKNGNLLRKDRENTTRYKPMTQIVNVGPAAPVVEPAPVPETPPATEQPAETPAPAETNPPAENIPAA